MHVNYFMSLTYFIIMMRFEVDLVDFMLKPPAQDEFRTWRLEALIMENIRNIHVDQFNDVVQILYKCIDQIYKAKNLKIKYSLNVNILFICMYVCNYVTYVSFSCFRICEA